MSNWKNKKFYLSPTIAISEVGEQAILLNTETGSYYQLNKIGRFITEQLENKNDFDELAQIILENFQISEDVCHNDLDTFLDSLNQRNLLVVIGPND